MAEISKPGEDWWLEVRTGIPFCVYYFGPFLTAEEAEDHAGGYLDDLIMEGAQEIWLIAKQCQPTQLTIELDEEKLILIPNPGHMGTEKQFDLHDDVGGGGYCSIPTR